MTDDERNFLQRVMDRRDQYRQEGVEARLHLRKLAIAVLATPQPMPPRLLELARNVMEGDDSE